MRPSLRAGHLLAACCLATGCGDPTNPGSGRELAFAVEPTATMVGDTIAPAVEVVILDRRGDPASAATDVVTLTVGAGPAEGQLLGTVTRAAVAGVAVFPGLSIDRAGAGYTLLASADGLTGDESARFDVIGFAALSTGTAFSCGLAIGNRGFCWGDNLAGGLGNGTTTSSSRPVPVADGLTLVDMSTGFAHACGLTYRGSAYCWGLNTDGQMGNGVTSDSARPAQVDGGRRWQALSAGWSFSCGITSGGQTYCWGGNSLGQLGNGLTAGSSIPVPVAGDFTFVTVSAGEGAACGVTAARAAYCWGFDENGQLGVGGSTDLIYRAPTAVAGGLEFVAVTVGGAHACGLSPEGTAYCWGENAAGQLGDSALTVEPYPCPVRCSRTPARVAGGMTFTALSAGYGHTCGITSAGRAYCWGDNSTGQLGTGGAGNRNAPTPVSGSALVFSAVTAGMWHTCGLTTSGKPYCWGDNWAGELGDGTTRGSRVPRPVSTPVLQ